MQLYIRSSFKNKKEAIFLNLLKIQKTILNNFKKKKGMKTSS
jgi:hypothetical protein